MHQFQLTTVEIPPNGIWMIRFGEKNEDIGQRDVASCCTHYSSNVQNCWDSFYGSDKFEAVHWMQIWHNLKNIEKLEGLGFMISELTAYDTNQDSSVLKK